MHRHILWKAMNCCILKLGNEAAFEQGLHCVQIEFSPRLKHLAIIMGNLWTECVEVFTYFSRLPNKLANKLSPKDVSAVSLPASIFVDGQALCFPWKWCKLVCACLLAGVPMRAHTWMYVYSCVFTHMWSYVYKCTLTPKLTFISCRYTQSDMYIYHAHACIISCTLAQSWRMCTWIDMIYLHAHACTHTQAHLHAFRSTHT